MIVFIYAFIAVLVAMLIFAAVYLYIFNRDKREAPLLPPSLDDGGGEGEEDFFALAVEDAVSDRREQWEYALYKIFCAQGKDVVLSRLDELHFALEHLNMRIAPDEFENMVSHAFFLQGAALFIDGKAVTRQGVFDAYKNGFSHFSYFSQGNKLFICTPQILTNSRKRLIINCSENALLQGLESQNAYLNAKEAANLAAANLAYGDFTASGGQTGIEIPLSSVIFKQPELAVLFDTLVQAADPIIAAAVNNGGYALSAPPLLDAALAVNGGKNIFAKLYGVLGAVYGLDAYLSFPVEGRFKFKGKLLWQSPRIKDEKTRRAAQLIYTYLDMAMELQIFFARRFDAETAYFKAYQCLLAYIKMFDYDYAERTLHVIQQENIKSSLADLYDSFNRAVRQLSVTHGKYARYFAWRKVRTIKPLP